MTVENVLPPKDGKNPDSLEKIFRDYASGPVSVPRSEIVRAKALWPIIVDHLAGKLGDEFLGHFLAGSYARKVQVRKLQDIDIIIELADLTGDFAASARDALLVIAEDMSDCELVFGQPDPKVRAVKLTLNGVEFTVDLVPALCVEGSRHRLALNKPEEGLNLWTPANPKGQTTAAQEKNQALGGNYIAMAKLIKDWNQSFGDDDEKAMPSYLAEAILFHALEEWPGFGPAIVAFFQSAAVHLAVAEPTVTCPGDEANFVDQLLKDERRERALLLVLEAGDAARHALDEAEEGPALDKWSKVFTSRDFPAPVNDIDRQLKAMQKGKISVIGTGVAVGTSGRAAVRGRSWRP